MDKQKQAVHVDQRFIEGLVRHDRVIIEEIYQRNAGRIRSLVVRNSGDADDAQDLFQEVLMALYRQGQGGLKLRCPFDVFFYIACRNRWINELKKRGRRRVTITDPEGFIMQSAAIPEVESWQKREEKEHLFHQKFQELGPSCRELLGLSWTLNPDTGKYNSLLEVASMLDRSYGYVRKKVGECRARFMQLIRESGAYKDL